MYQYLFWFLLNFFAIGLPVEIFSIYATDSTFSEITEITPLDSLQLVEFLQKQIHAIRDGKITNAYNDFTSQDFKDSTSLEDFQKFVNRFDVLSNNQSLKIYTLYAENGKGTLQGILTSYSGNSMKVDYDLIFENGTWKITGIQLFKIKQP